MPYFDKRRKKWIGQVIFAQKTPSGRPRKKTQQFATEREALLWEVKQGAVRNEPTSIISLGDLATEYLSECKRRYSHDTYVEKCRAFRELFTTVNPAMEATALTRSQVSAHLNAIFDELGGNVANRRRKNLVAAWNWASQEYVGFPTFNPMMVRRYPEQRHPRYIPPEEDFWKVYRRAETEQDRAMLLAYLHTAARKAELFRLTWEDVDLSRKRIQLYTRKRRDGSVEYDWIPMTEELGKALTALKLRSTSALVFPAEDGKQYTVRRRWMLGLCQRAGVKAFGLHAIRHLTASILVAADAPLIDIQAILRHKAITTTERYLHRLKSARGTMRVLENRASIPSSGHKTTVGTEPAKPAKILHFVRSG